MIELEETSAGPFPTHAVYGVYIEGPVYSYAMCRSSFQKWTGLRANAVITFPLQFKLNTQQSFARLLLTRV